MSIGAQFMFWNYYSCWK